MRAKGKGERGRGKGEGVNSSLTLSPFPFALGFIRLTGRRERCEDDASLIAQCFVIEVLALIAI